MHACYKYFAGINKYRIYHYGAHK